MGTVATPVWLRCRQRAFNGERGGSRSNSYRKSLRGRVFQVSCAVTFEHNTTNQPMVITYEGDCAVIGGPISFEIVAGSVPSRHHDEDEESPWYVQYFGYTYVRPSDVQARQYALASVMLQPETTELEWTVPLPLWSLSRIVVGEVDQIDVQAIGANVDPLKIGCSFFLEFEGMHGDYDSGSTDDNTGSSKVWSGGKLLSMTAEVSIHTPDSVGIVHPELTLNS